ncbi:MAG: ATP-binding cassette domain-containing protein [Desulfatibacillum sp.]|nr:ATP-binding cassette domain-containing protein [Desulfatibacillum sp.]
MDLEPIISVRNLTAGYGETRILEDVSFDVTPGEILMIVGGSGCGKSTLLKHMIGQLAPVSGEIMVDGCNLISSTTAEYQALLKRIGVLYQGSALLSSLTVGQNVALPMLEHTDLPKDAVESLVRIKLSMVYLAGTENLLPSELSGGMRKRAGLARAMALNPRILFFDEPSAGLDPITSSELDRLILRLNKIFGTTMVVVTHELRSIFAVAQRVIMLDKKTRGIVAQGHPLDLKNQSPHPQVRDFFNPPGQDNCD